MRRIATWAALCVACGSASRTSERPVAARPAARLPAAPDAAPIDVLAALGASPAERAWVVPGSLWLELGSAPVASVPGGKPFAAAAIDRQGHLERIAIRLEHARFAAWVERAQLLLVLQRDHRLAEARPGLGGEAAVTLRAGAAVRRLAHRPGATHVRYLGSVQVEGWIPDGVLGEHGPAREQLGRVATGHRPQLMTPGAVIRAEPSWPAAELAVVASGYFVDVLRELDGGWSEVSYQDGEVIVRGFWSRRDPPSRVHRWEVEAPAPVAANATAASGTCLYARVDGEPVGYVVGDRPVALDDAQAGWWSLALDTPWGPVAFAARGPARNELVACAPAGAVPPPTRAP